MGNDKKGLFLGTCAKDVSQRIYLAEFKDKSSREQNVVYYSDEDFSYDIVSVTASAYHIALEKDSIPIVFVCSSKARFASEVFYVQNEYTKFVDVSDEEGLGQLVSIYLEKCGSILMPDEHCQSREYVLSRLALELENYQEYKTVSNI